MNRRIFKKRCKRAMEILIRDHGMRADQFSVVDGREEREAPRGVKADKYNSFVPLRGTPECWQQVSYEYGEWDPTFPTEILADALMFNSPEFEAWCEEQCREDDAKLAKGQQP